MDPFHVVHLAADKLTVCRQRIQQATTGHRGRGGDPLYGIRRTLNTRAELLTDKQKVRLFTAFTAHDAHAAVEVTYGVYQRLITANEDSGKRGRSEEHTSELQSLMSNSYAVFCLK